MKHSLRVIVWLIVVFGVTQPSAAQARLSDYTVGPQDVLQISVVDEPALTNRFRVDSDGSISFPHLGRVAVSGLTPSAIEQKLKLELERRQFYQPGRLQISVDVAEFRSRSVFILGAVKQPNQYRLIGETSLIAAIAQAGGLSEAASDQINILRPREGQPQGALTPDKAKSDIAEITTIKMSELLTGDFGKNISLQDGDTIYIQPAEKFFVEGMVRNVGAYIHSPGLTVQQALALAGGITELGSDRRISIIRMVNGKKKTIKARLTDLVQPGDSIKVERRRF